MSYARVSITLPERLLADLDRRAKAIDRPRSWVVAEAVRTYLTSAPAAAGEPASHGRNRVSEPAPPPYAALDVAAARRRHLEAELRLSPAERLRRAEGLVRLARRTGAGHKHQIVGFDSYEDFYEWKQARRAGG